MLCLYCGTEHDPASGSFCLACGMFVGRPTGAAPARRAPSAPPAEAHCAECGVPTEGRLRCPACGARLQRAEHELDPEERLELERRSRARGAPAPELARSDVARALEEGAREVDLLAAPPVVIDEAVLGRPDELDLLGAPPVVIDGVALGRQDELDLEGAPGIAGPAPAPASAVAPPAAAAPAAPVPPRAASAPPAAAPPAATGLLAAVPPDLPPWDAPFDDDVTLGVEFDRPDHPPRSR